MNKEELHTTQDIVMDILKSHPETRNSDNYLSYWVYKFIGQKNGIDIDSMPITRFFLHMKDYGFPSTETIRRTRQKIQADHPELSADKSVEYKRNLYEEFFIEYARGE